MSDSPAVTTKEVRTENGRTVYETKYNGVVIGEIGIPIIPNLASFEFNGDCWAKFGGEDDQWPGDNGPLQATYITSLGEGVPIMVTFTSPLGDRLFMGGNQFNPSFRAMHAVCEQEKWRGVRNAEVRDKLAFLDSVSDHRSRIKQLEAEKERERQKEGAEQA